MVDAEHIHSKYLHRLTHELHHAGIEQSDVAFTLVEPVWYHRQGNQRSLCDLIVGMKRSGAAIPIELKSNSLAKDDAIKQLREGVYFANRFLHRRVPYVVFMVYDGDRDLYLPPEKIVDELPDQNKKLFSRIHE